MISETVQLERLVRDHDRLEAVLSLEVDASPADVWRALTAEDRLVDWLAPGSVEPRLGGAVRIDFVNSGQIIDSRVSAWEAGRVLEYSWSDDGDPERLVRWELRALDDGVALSLRLRIPAAEDAARAFAGWTAHLEMLAATLAGAAVRFPNQCFTEARRLFDLEIASLEAAGAVQAAA